MILWQKILEVRKSLRSKIVYATTGKMSAINFTSATISVWLTPISLTFSNHLHDLIANNRSSGSMKRFKSSTGIDQFLDAAMIWRSRDYSNIYFVASCNAWASISSVFNWSTTGAIVAFLARLITPAQELWVVFKALHYKRFAARLSRQRT